MTMLSTMKHPVAFASVFALVALTMSPSASAAPRKEHPIMRHIAGLTAKGAQKPLEGRKIAPQCTNFSGKWAGQCTDQFGDTNTSEMNITQEDCSRISMWGAEFPINGTTTLSEHDNNGQGFIASATYAWNDAQTRLTHLTNAQIAGMGIGFVFRGQIWLAGNQLRIKAMEGAAVNLDLGNVSAILDDCTYDRVE